MTPRARSLAALAELAQRDALSDARWAHCGALALEAYGVFDGESELMVVADRPLPDDVQPQVATRDGQRWTPAGGASIVWRARQDHFAPLFQAAIESATSRPSQARAERATTSPAVVSPAIVSPATVSGPALAALLLQRRDESPTLLQVLMAGSVDFDEARAFTCTHLGPYALDDLENVMQEAEWLLMRQRYTDKNGLN